MRKRKAKKAGLSSRNTADRIMRMKDNGFKSTTQVHDSDNKYSRAKVKLETKLTLKTKIEPDDEL